MKKICTMIILMIIISCAGPVFAETNQESVRYDNSPGVGMEERKVNNDVTVLMPKGSKMYKRNESTQVMEGIDEYSARKFVDMEKRLDKLDKETAEMKEEINNLKSKLSNIGKSPNADLPKDAER